MKNIAMYSRTLYSKYFQFQIIELYKKSGKKFDFSNIISLLFSIKLNKNHAITGEISHAIFLETWNIHWFFARLLFSSSDIFFKYSDKTAQRITHQISKVVLAHNASVKLESVVNKINDKNIENIENLNKIPLENFHNKTEIKRVVIIQNHAAIEFIVHTVSQDWKISNK